jgi:4-hydroxy-tetrahydrodipicolinate synthase
VISHLVGLQLKQIIDEYVEGKIEKAAAAHRKLLPFVNAMFVVANPMPVKYALNYAGFPVGKTRLPLTEPDEKSRAVIEQTLKSYKIDLPIGAKA